MKQIVISLLLGTILGMLLGGVIYQKQYLDLYNKYDGAIELLRLYKNHYEKNTD